MTKSETVAETPRKKRLSLSSWILISLVLGVACGLFFGEYCRSLKHIGTAFIHLLQMTVLPYIVVSLMAGIGQMTYERAKKLAIRAGLVLAVIWGITLLVVLVLPLSFPTWQSASFFTTALVEARQSVSFVDLYIPKNPFKSLAENVVPAVVLFSMALGISFIGMGKRKDQLVETLHVLSEALMRVARFTVRLTPIGVFAISANAAGTLSLAEIERLQVYFIAYVAGALVLAFWVLPALVTVFTPFSYKDVVGISWEVVLTGFTTGSIFIVLPGLIQNSKELFHRYQIGGKDADSAVDVLIPVAFNFPNAGKLLALLFILFGGWFVGSPIEITEYPIVAGAGLLALFGGVTLAVPYMLDLMHLPADLFEFFLVTGILTSRFATVVAAMSLLAFTLLATCMLTGSFRVSKARLLRYGGVTAGVLIGATFGTRILLGATVDNTYSADRIVLEMQLLENPAPNVVVLESLPERREEDRSVPAMNRIRARGLRVGYDDTRLPFCYLNSAADLVGFDVEMAHRLARDLDVDLEFVPADVEKMHEQLDAGLYDIAMMGVGATPERQEVVDLSVSYLDLTWSLVVRDHRRHDFQTMEQFRAAKGLRIAMRPSAYVTRQLQIVFPDIKPVPISSAKEFFKEADEERFDALLIPAEVGAAWTLLYPEFTVVVPKPGTARFPIAYAVRKGDRELVEIVNRWIEIKKKGSVIEQAYDHWILGKGATKREPRWSVIRDVLGWVE